MINFKKTPTSELIKSINNWNKEYWDKGLQPVEDTKYDSAVSELQTRLPANELISKIYSPNVFSTGKSKHKTPMLSLDKVYSLEDLKKWMKSVSRDENEKFILQPKYDGIATSWDGMNLCTRGDGEIGELINDKVPLIIAKTHFYKGEELPLASIRTNSTIYGELIITKSEFAKWKGVVIKQDGEDYKTPRNAISGIVGLNDISHLLNKATITLIEYKCQQSTPISMDLTQEYWDGYIRAFNKLDFPLDGMVVKLKDEEYSKSLGCTSHHPRGQIAFKFQNEGGTSKLLNVEWSFGKGCLTPVGLIQEVEIGGVKINRVTLHNYKNLIDNDIMIGDDLLVERAGDVIPHVVENIRGTNRKSPIISLCPECNSTLVCEGVNICCKNPECKGSIVELLYSSITSLDIKEIGKQTVKQMNEKLKIKTLVDLLNVKKEDLFLLEGFAETSVEKIYKIIQNAKITSQDRLLTSLNIPMVSIGTAKKILNVLKLEQLPNTTLLDLENIQGIGRERAIQLRRYFKFNLDYFQKLLTLVEFKEQEVKQNLKTICFTGKMPEKRSYYEKIAKERGFEVIENVKKNMDLLVVAEVSDISTKIKDANRYNIKIKEINEWLKEV